MTTTWTEADFESMCWHDCRLWGIELQWGYLEEDYQTDALVLDIDYILEWVSDCGTYRFRVAPATLAFHGITDLAIALDWGDTGFQNGNMDAWIDRIERTIIEDQKVCLDRRYYSWRIPVHAPSSGEIRFGAADFTQTLRNDPILIEHQSLAFRKRVPML